ncbi:MAG TPA: CpsB/CapC family capsule biosynthesis tyrosine phosphatase [Anaerolineales bacterium]
MIDLHNHIMPGVDDGAADLSESLEIARQFVREGVHRIAATPHLDPERKNGIAAPAVRAALPELTAAIKDAGIDLEVVAGNELYLTPDALTLVEKGMVATLGDSRFLLVEVSLLSARRPPYLDDVLFKLQVGGYQPIFAHPERYPFVDRDVTALDDLLERGIFLQLTAASLLGEYGPHVRSTAERLLRRGAYALGASDRHHPEQKRSLAIMHDRIAELTDGEIADLLLSTNPSRVLADETLIVPPLHEPEPQGWLGRLLRH